MNKYVDRDKFMQNLEADKYGFTNCVKIGIALDKAAADVAPKSEVASEIFSEFENRIGIGHDILDFWDIFEELKKKYTEVQK